ncbi:MAG: hypothetical protein ACFE9L_09065 [Candidatus Hodarchaeota archaeon]
MNNNLCRKHNLPIKNWITRCDGRRIPLCEKCQNRDKIKNKSFRRTSRRNEMPDDWITKDGQAIPLFKGSKTPKFVDIPIKNGKGDGDGGENGKEPTWNLEEISEHFVDLIDRAEKKLIKKYPRIADEDDLTSRYIQQIEDVFSENSKYKNLIFEATKLKWRGKDSEENIYGADFCAILRFKLKGLMDVKGFLSQSKMDGDSIVVHPRNKNVIVQRRDEKLLNQARDMLNVTPASFILVYSQEKFVFIPANKIIKSEPSKIILSGILVKDFFKLFIKSFIGDIKVRSEFFDKLIEYRELKALQGVQFSVTEI